MSIASELTNLENNIGDAYDAVNDMSGIIPQHKNMANLDQAIRTIPQSSGPTPGDGTLTIQKNGSTVATFTANQSSNATANITVPTDTNDLTNGAGFITSSDSITGNAATATKLAAGKTIALGTGATGTATSFDGSSNITIPVTNVKDAYVTWGGKPIYNNISPDDAGCVDEFGHNKMAFLPANCIQVHYSTDGGSTWVDYGLTDAQKIQLVTYGDVYCKSGKDTTATSSNVTNLKLRVRIATAASTTTGASSLYTMWKKILININDPGSDATMTFRYRTIANYKAGTETWVDSGTTYAVRGGSGWNSIPIPTSWPDKFGGSYTTQTSQPGQIEFVFSNTKLGTWGDKKISVSSFRMIGVTNWVMPSEMARTGNIYSYDTSKNVTFPASVKVGGSLQKGNYTYTLPSKNGTVAMTSDVPTNTSDLVNDGSNGTSTYVEADQLASVATTGSYNDLSNKPTIVAGTINVGSMGAGRSEQTVSIPTQANANYVVLLSLGGAMSGGWTKISLSVASKTTSSFTMVNYNEAGYAVNNVLIDYLVIPR